MTVLCGSPVGPRIHGAHAVCPVLSWQVVYFVNSGSEANDLAVLMARAYTARAEPPSLIHTHAKPLRVTLGTLT